VDFTCPPPGDSYGSFGYIAHRRQFPTADRAGKFHFEALMERALERLTSGAIITVTARELLDTSSAHLRTLAAFLAEQLDESVAGSEDTVEVRACREVLHSLTALIP